MPQFSFSLDPASPTIVSEHSLVLTVTVTETLNSGDDFSAIPPVYLVTWATTVGNFSALPGGQVAQVQLAGIPVYASFHLTPAAFSGLAQLPVAMGSSQQLPPLKLPVLWDSTGVAPGQYLITITVHQVTHGADGTIPNSTQAFQLLTGQTPNPPIPGASLSAPLGYPPLTSTITVAAAPPVGPLVTVQMQRAMNPPTQDQALWSAIRKSTNALSFNNYDAFMEVVMCGGDNSVLNLNPATVNARRDPIKHRLRLPFPDTDAYRQLKVATEVFVMLNCGVFINDPSFTSLSQEDLDAESRRYYRAVLPGDIEKLWDELISDAQLITAGIPTPPTLPYLAIIRKKLSDVAIFNPRAHPNQFLQQEEAATSCMGILMEKLTHPCLLELIWSYWHEEGMLAQTMNAITWRFQNRHSPGDRDPLAMLEIDPLRPLNNFIWGYLQDEQHRLTVPRRAYEYDHHYGLNLVGKAVPMVRGADSRSRFLEAFHNLLFLCSIFYKEDDDTTVVADGFPILNALKEVHLLLTQGAHNQYGDLPWTARQEMLMQEWLLGRPEFREYLPTRIMVDYPERWMDRVEAMKTLQGWSNTSILHFRDLGVFGEQVLLGIRFGAWPSQIEPQFAANWARYWRPEIQGYYHAYRAVTGVDLTERVDPTLPSLLLQQRLKGLPYDTAAIPPGRERLQLPPGRTATRALPRLR